MYYSKIKPYGVRNCNTRDHSFPEELVSSLPRHRQNRGGKSRRNKTETEPNIFFFPIYMIYLNCFQEV